MNTKANREIKDTEFHTTMADTKPENNEVEVEEKTEFSQLFPGNHIAVTRGPYYLHDIFTYAEYCIVDYGGENKKDATTKNLWGEKRMNTMANREIKDTEVHITMADTKPENNEVEVEEKTEFSQLFPGNHIAVTGWPYFHHGIVIHSEYGVVNCGGENKKDAATKNLWGEKRLPAIKEKRRNHRIIHDAESIDADTNGQEMTVERHESYRNYNWSCHDTKLMKSALRFAYTVLPCAGGTDPGKSQRGNQDHSQIYHASLKFLSKCPHPSEYVNKTLEKCVNVCGSYIQDGNCTYHCMRDSSKTKLVEFCAKPKILFGFCPEYDPVDQTIQKDTTTLCNSTSTHNHYNSSDIYFCNPDNCLQLLVSDVRSSATTLMTGTTEMNGGNLQEVWPLQNWTLILLIVVVVIGLAISFACILYKQGHCRTRHRNEKLTNYAETGWQKLLRRQ